MPEEDKVGDEEDMIGVLEPGEGKSLYGTRSAARNWQYETHRVCIDEMKMTPCLSSPCLFHEPEEDVRMAIHGDDLTILADEEGCQYVQSNVNRHWTTKQKGKLGPYPDEGDQSEVATLNRILRLTPKGAEIEGDMRHAELIAAETGMIASRGCATPGTQERTVQPGDDVNLPAHKATAYRGIVCRGIYYAEDRNEARYATKELARSMKNPNYGDLKALKRLGRYYKRYPRAVLTMPLQGELAGEPTIHRLMIKVDSNHGNCHITRKSTSGGHVMHGRHAVTGWSSTQGEVTTASGISEFLAMLKGAFEGLGMQSMLDEIDLHFELELHTDSSAALGISMRQGLGKVKHRHVKDLWLQQAVKKKLLSVHKSKGTENEGDMMTKHLSEKDLQASMKMIGLEYREGRSGLAPRLADGVARQRVTAILVAAIIMDRLCTTMSESTPRGASVNRKGVVLTHEKKLRKNSENRIQVYTETTLNVVNYIMGKGAYEVFWDFTLLEVFLAGVAAGIVMLIMVQKIRAYRHAKDMTLALENRVPRGTFLKTPTGARLHSFYDCRSVQHLTRMQLDNHQERECVNCKARRERLFHEHDA